MISSGSSSVTLDELLSRTTEAEIISHYLNLSYIPCVICSPLRKDKNPSFGIYATAGNRVFFKDFSTNESGGIIDLLSRMWGYSYNEVLSRIEKDISSFSKKVTVTPSSYDGSQEGRNNVDIQVKVREWRDYDDEYWKSYGITRKWLEFAEVYPISHKIVTKNGERYIFGAEKYAYVFVEHKDGNTTLKIYQPFSKDYKWSTNIDRSVWSLWSKIPRSGNSLIISSSLKDCLNLWCNLGIPSICMQGEGYLPKPHIMEELKDRFRNIMVFYDNDCGNPDNPGRTDSLNLCRTYGLQRLEIPEKYQAKDPSDLFKKYGVQEYLNIMKEIFRNKEDYGK